MSADLHLFAAPDTARTRFWLRMYGEVDMIGGDVDWHEEELPPDIAAKVGKPALVTVSSAFHEKMTAALFGRGWSGPNVWVGQVSWAKASLFADGGAGQQYVPACVARVQGLTEDAPVLTPALAKAITVAMNLKNRSIYGKPGYASSSRPADLLERWNGPVQKFGPHYIQRVKGSRGVTTGKEIKRFLDGHIGDIIIPESL